MINKNNKYLGAALVTITVAGMVAAPQAMAKKAKKVQASTISEYHHSVTTTRSNTSAIEAQLRALEDEVASLKAQVKASAPTAAVVTADSQKIQELDAWAASVKAGHEKHEKHHEKENLLYFRGGYAGNDQPLAATTNTATLANGQVATLGTGGKSDGWNFGAGLDFHLNDNLFGLVDKTDLLGELDLNYVDLGSFQAAAISTVANYAVTGHPSGAISNTQKASQSMLRISASPKIKLCLATWACLFAVFAFHRDAADLGPRLVIKINYKSGAMLHQILRNHVGAMWRQLLQKRIETQDS